MGEKISKARRVLADAIAGGCRDDATIIRLRGEAEALRNSLMRQRENSANLSAELSLERDRLARAMAKNAIMSAALHKIAKMGRSINVFCDRRTVREIARKALDEAGR